MIKRLPILFALGAGIFCLHAAGQGNEVVVIYNRRMAESRDVAEHYAEMRQVPAGQVLGFDLPVGENISREDFRDRLQVPLTKALTGQKLWVFGSRPAAATNVQASRISSGVIDSKIRYAVLCYGVPLRILEDPDLREEGSEKVVAEFRRNGAAVDSELACLPLLAGKMHLTGPVANPLYGSTNENLFNPTNGLLMVTRLDGPTAAIARGLVDKAMQAERDGLWGRAYFDLRGLTNGPYKIGDDSMRFASEVSRQLGFDTVVDTNSGTLPASFPLSQVALYAGWYELDVTGAFARPTVEFMPGAFAYHLHSVSAASLRSTDRNWVGPLLARGVTATMGCVDEPYLVGTPDMGVFFNCFAHLGFSFGEAAYSDQQFLSWQTTVVGDPLYRPFAKPLQQRYDELAAQKSRLVEWAWLRLVNLRLLGGAPLAEVANSLDNLALTHQSAVLEEKLAELFARQGKPESAIRALQAALNLEPSPQQRVRLMLELASQLIAQNRELEAYEVYQQFLSEVPDYPDMAAIYRRLAGLAQKLDREEDAEKYRRELSRPGASPKE